MSNRSYFVTIGVTSLLLACRTATVPPGIDTGAADRDCDGIPATTDCDDADDLVGAARTWHADGDGDGYGDAAAPTLSCDRPDGHVRDATDCDDSDADAHPGAREVCGGGDEDCDGLVDGDDPGVTGQEALYTDGDGDGWGAGDAADACAADGLVAEGGDCDDDDPDRYPGHRCRPDPGCAHADVDALAAVANLSISDVAFDADCNAWLPNVVVVDSVQVVHASGAVLAEFDTWDGNCDLPAIALDPDDGDAWLMGTDNTYAIVGTIGDDAVEHVADGVFTKGSSWIGTYMNWVAQSIASDGACVWVPNFAGDGTVVCVREDGSQETAATLPERSETVALDPDGALYASAGSSIYAVSPDTGTTDVSWSLDAAVLDMVFDYDGTLYVETTDDVLWRIEPGGDPAWFADVAYDGKLAISPDGWLVRVMPYWDGGLADVASKWEEWELGD